MDETGMNLDIIVLNYDNKGFIEKCIESILNTMPPNAKLYVVDQGSKDGSLEWLREKEGIHMLIENEYNTGAWEGRNQALRESKGDWIMFFDSDTEILDPNWFSQMLKNTDNRITGVVEARVKLWNGTYRFGGFAACMIRREVFRTIGLFDRHFLIGGDQDFWVKFAWASEMEIEFEDDTDILHHCGRTINRDRKNQEEESQEHKFYRQQLPRYIYMPQFLDETVGNIDRLRQDEERKRGWIQ